MGPRAASSPSRPRGRSAPVTWSTALYSASPPSSAASPAIPAGLGQPTVCTRSSTGPPGLVNVVAAEVSLIPYAVTSCGTPSTPLRSFHRLAGADEAADITECSDERSKDDFLATSTMARLIVGT